MTGLALQVPGGWEWLALAIILLIALAVTIRIVRSNRGDHGERD